jgi:hypothetical protein
MAARTRSTQRNFVLVIHGSRRLVHNAVVDIQARQVLTLESWAEAKKVVQ